MSNFSAFTPEHLDKLLSPFVPGMSRFITPIKYEALTPDLFALLFRTTSQDGGNHYFVSLEFDYVVDLKHARQVIEDWHGSFVRFWSLVTDGVAEKPTVEDVSAVTKDPYRALLAEVKRPTGNGYWATNVIIMPGDTINEKIGHFSPAQQKSIRDGLKKLLRAKVDPTQSVVASYQTRSVDPLKGGVNNSDMAVSVFMNAAGEVEFFYNYVRQTN